MTLKSLQAAKSRERKQVIENVPAFGASSVASAASHFSRVLMTSNKRSQVIAWTLVDRYSSSKGL